MGIGGHCNERIPPVLVKSHLFFLAILDGLRLTDWGRIACTRRDDSGSSIGIPGPCKSQG